MKLHFIQEPLLEFGQGKHICPKAGITQYDVYDTRLDARRDRILVGAVGTSDTLSRLAVWLEKCSKAGFKTPIGIGVEFLNGCGLFFDHRKEYIRWLSIPVKSPKPNGPKSSLCCPNHPVPLKEVVDASPIGRCLRAFYGSYAVERAGKICRVDTLPSAPVGVGYKNGKKPRYGSTLGGLF